MNLLITPMMEIKNLMNAIHYLCDDRGLTNLKSKQIRLRLLDKEKISSNKLLIELINIIHH